MLQVDQEKLMRLLEARRVSLKWTGQGLRCLASVDLQHVLAGSRFFSVPFVKVLLTLGVGFEEIVAGALSAA